MNITQEKVDALNAEITLHLAPEDYRDNVNNELKKQAKKASLPGFRPGKVPIGVIRKMAGMAVLMEELNKRVGQELNQFIRDQEMRILGEPLPKGEKKAEDFDVNCEIDLEFIFEVGLAPSIKLNLNLEDAPVLHEVTVGDEFIDEEIKKNQDRFGAVTQPEQMEMGDIVYGKINETDSEGNLVEEGFEKMVALNPERVKNDAVFTQFVGKEIDAVFPFDPFSINEDLAELAGLLFMDKDTLESIRGKSFQFQLKRINRVVPAELNADFFFKVLNPEKAYGQIPDDAEDRVETEEAFRAQLKARIEKEFGDHTQWYYRKQLRERLVTNHGIELPEAFLKRWISETNRKKEDDSPLSPEEVDTQYVSFSESVRWSLLVEEIQKAHPGIKVEEAELRKGIKEMILKNVPGITEDQEEGFMQHAMQNEEIVQGQYNRLFDEKLFEVINEQIVPKTSQIDAKAFLDLVNEA